MEEKGYMDGKYYEGKGYYWKGKFLKTNSGRDAFELGQFHGRIIVKTAVSEHGLQELMRIVSKVKKSKFLNDYEEGKVKAILQEAQKYLNPGNKR